MIIDLLIRRYRDGYRVAEGLVSTGGTLKITAWVVGAVFIGLAILSGQSHTNDPFSGVANTVASMATVISVGIAIASWIFFFTLGVLFCAAGQLLYAALDTAINTSPFLPVGARAAAMGLPPPPPVPTQAQPAAPM